MSTGSELLAARPRLMRAMNEQLILSRIRADGPCSRADLARLSGLSKPTVSLTLANVERAGLVREAGQRTGVPGRTAVLYEIRPEAGYVLALDIGSKYLRGAVADLAGAVRARSSRPVAARGVRSRITELVRFADSLCGSAGVTRADVTATVIGSPGVVDSSLDAIALPGGLAGWDRPGALAGVREAFGDSVRIENDVDAAALAERAHGHGRSGQTFAFVHVGTGIGMGLVIDGKLHRGAHGVAGEIAFMPLGSSAAGCSAGGCSAAGCSAAGSWAAGSSAGGGSADEAKRLGSLEVAAAASGIVRAARVAGMRGPLSARQVFTAASRGDERAVAVVAAEARMVAQAICCVVAVVDPALVVLGGGIGQAPGFASAVAEALADLAPVLPEVKVSALGTDAVVDGCLAEGADLAWSRLTGA